MWAKSVSQLTQEQLRYLTCSLRPDTTLNLHFLKAIKNYNSNSPQTRKKKKKNCRKQLKLRSKSHFFSAQFQHPKEKNTSMTITDENRMNVIGISYFSPLRYKIYIEIWYYTITNCTFHSSVLISFKPCLI